MPEPEVDAVDAAMHEALKEPETEVAETAETVEETEEEAPAAESAQPEVTETEKDEFEDDMVKFKGKMIPYERFQKLNLSRKEAQKAIKTKEDAEKAWLAEKTEWGKRGESWKAFAGNFRKAIKDDPELDEIFADAFVKGEMDYAKLSKAIEKHNKVVEKQEERVENEFRDPRVDGLLKEMKQQQEKQQFDQEVTKWKGAYAGDLKKLKGEFKELGNADVLGDFLERFELMAASYDENKLPSLYDAGKSFVARVRKQRESLFAEQDQIAQKKSASKIPVTSGPSGKTETSKLPEAFDIFGDDAARILADEVDKEMAR